MDTDFAAGGPPREGTGGFSVRPPAWKWRRRPFHPLVNLLFFLATLLSTLVAGALMTLNDISIGTAWDVLTSPGLWSLGLPYSASLIAILGSHEMGHYVACRLYRIDASLPFFIPAPNLFGTFGAVIRIRAPFSDRRALFDVGVAGPIAGFVVALPILVYGISRSVVVHESPKPGDIGLPSCLLLEILFRVIGDERAGQSLRLDPVFAAGWIGMLATGLNLLPIGQLDGGHMLYSLSKRTHRIVSRYGIWLMIGTGLLLGGWHLILFGLLFAFLGVGHPPPLDEARGLGRGRLGVAFLGLVIFLLTIIPQGPRLF